MTDSTDNDARLPADEPEGQHPPGEPRPWWHKVGVALRYALTLIVALAAAAVVTSLSIDLGPSLRERAERAGSGQIRRPLHIGKLSVRLLTGDFILEDLMIEGLTPEDRPFLTAKQIVLDVPWWSIVRRDLLIRSVVMTDWEMVVETYDGGTHNFPRFVSSEPRGPRPFTTTVQFVRASGGQFIFDDHEGSPWQMVAPGLDVTVTKLVGYGGQASFSKGTVQFASFLPMWADMTSSFKIDGGIVEFDRIDLNTDGAKSHVTGTVDLGRWPEQTHHVRSRVDFRRMREIFFAENTFSLSGEGDFEGTFHLFKGGHELKGGFKSALSGFNQFEFPDLHGKLLWTSDRFEVTKTASRFHGGSLDLEYSMKPLGQPTPGVASFLASYRDVDLAELSDRLELQGIRVAGQATGRNELHWPLGRMAERRGGGSIAVAAPVGVEVMPRQLPASLSRQAPSAVSRAAPFDRTPLRGYVPIGGELGYLFGPEWIEIAPSRLASEKTFVEFSGRTAYGEQSQIPFHVTSSDWQESDRLLAGIMTAFGAPTSAVPIGGFGTFDGVMLEAFRRPRVQGRFDGQRMRAWGVDWGRIQADLEIENAYAVITEGAVLAGESRLDVTGRFSLGFPRADGGEEINARFRIDRRPVVDLRHAFGLDDYSVDGRLSGEFHAYGRYQGPEGFGRMMLDAGAAYGEGFETAAAGVRLEGNGVRLDAIEVAKSDGAITGAAFVGFDGTYSFEADGRRINIDKVALVQSTTLPLTGLFRFSASGKGTFDSPSYEVRAAIDDLFLADEGIGQVTGRFSVREKVLTFDQFDAASPRLTMSGTGRIGLTSKADADLTIRVNDTSLDPYARLYLPQISPFASAVASGTIQVTGELRNTERLNVETVVEQLNLRLFDYPIANDGAIRLLLNRGLLRVDRLRLLGEGTELEVGGDARISDGHLNVSAVGDANLAVLQGFIRDIRSTGRVALRATVQGTMNQPVLGGNFSVEGGRIRHFALPHSIDELNGRIEFDADGMRVEALTGTLGGGRVTFGGMVGFAGFTPNELNLTANGEDLRLRYPEGFRSVVNTDLALRGKMTDAVLSGTVTVKDAIWVKSFDPSGAGVFALPGGEGVGTVPDAVVPPASPPGVPIRFDVRIEAPSSLHIENNTARLVSSASLTLQGSFDRPLLFGTAEIDRGDVLFEGHRYVVTRGTVEFANPSKIEPFFDIEAETRARAPGETYRVTFRVSGTSNRLVFDLTSDPPLPLVDILGLLFGDTRDIQNAELRALRAPDQSQQELIASRAARLLASPLSSGVGRAVEEAFGVDSVQITPSLGDPSAQQLSRLNPGARLTISKRISERMFLTLSRTLTTSVGEQVILLEYSQSDRLSWMLTQNEDRTYAIDFRVRRMY